MMRPWPIVFSAFLMVIPRKVPQNIYRARVVFATLESEDLGSRPEVLAGEEQVRPPSYFPGSSICSERHFILPGGTIPYPSRA